jgi:hypothetical protein
MKNQNTKLSGDNMFFKKKKMVSNILKVDDMVLLTMLNFPNGVFGESTIHEFIYSLVDVEPYSDMKKILSFIDVENGLHFSHVVHKSIVDNCRDVSNVEQGSFPSQSSTAAMFSDNLRFDLYDIVNEKEKGLRDLVSNYSPKVYFVSAMGRAAAILALRERLNNEQKKVLLELAGGYGEE